MDGWIDGRMDGSIDKQIDKCNSAKAQCFQRSTMFDPFVSICVCVRVCVYVGAHGHFITNGCSILYTVLMSRRVDTLTGLTVHFQMFFATRASEVGAPGIERQQEDICPLFTTQVILGHLGVLWLLQVSSSCVWFHRLNLCHVETCLRDFYRFYGQPVFGDSTPISQICPIDSSIPESLLRTHPENPAF